MSSTQSALMECYQTAGEESTSSHELIAPAEQEIPEYVHEHLSSQNQVRGGQGLLSRLEVAEGSTHEYSPGFHQQLQQETKHIDINSILRGTTGLQSRKVNLYD